MRWCDLALVTLIGCAEVTAPATASSTASGEPAVVPTGPCDSSALTWENTGGPILIGYCAPCHSSGLAGHDRQAAPIGVDFDTLALAQSFGDRIVARAVTAMDMPPSGPIAEADMLRLADWIACGMP